MADRLPQYQPVHPSLLQQQQIPQSQPLGHVEPPSSSSFANPEQARMWQHLQHMQNQFPPASGGEMKPYPLNMADILRSQSLNRAQPSQPGGQQFGLAPQPSFQDQPSQQTQHVMPPNFSGMGSGLGTASQVQQAIGSRGAMIGFQANNSSPMSRQLEMVGMAVNQQPQNGSMSYPGRLIQQPQQPANMATHPGQRPPQSDVFPPQHIPASDGIRNSPSQTSQNPNSVGNHLPITQPNSQAPRRPMTFQELRDRAQYHSRMVELNKGMIEKTSAQRSTIPDTDYYAKMQKHETELNHHQDVLNKVLNAMRQVVPHANGQAGGNSGNMNPMVVSAQALQPSAPLAVGPNQQVWIPQGQSQPHGFRNAQMGQGGARGPPNIQHSPRQLHAQSNLTQPPNAIPSRSGPTSQQSSVPGTGSNVPPQFPFQPSSGQVQPPPRTEPHLQIPYVQIPPLDKTRFESAYNNFRAKHQINRDVRLMSDDNRLIDLHSLHVQVINEGGVGMVDQKELWPYIAGRMGFVKFPGNESEPAKSGPGVAQELAHVYKEYLAGFDQVYIQSVFQSKRKMQATTVHHAQPQLGVAGAQAPARAFSNPQQLQAVIHYAHIPASELRAKGVPDSIIQLVEANRAQLQQSLKIQQQWRGNLVNSPSQPGLPLQPAGQDRTPSGGTGQSQSQPNPPSSHQVGAPPHMISGNNNVDSQAPRPQASNINGASSALSSKEQVQVIKGIIDSMKHDFLNHRLANTQTHTIPDNQKAIFTALLEQLCQHSMEFETKLLVYWRLFKSDETIRRLIAITATIQHQKQLLASPTPRYIVDLTMLRAIGLQLQQALVGISNHIKKQQEVAAHQTGSNQPQPTAPQALQVRPTTLSTTPQRIPPPPNRPVSLMQPPAGRKKASPIPPRQSPSLPAASTPIPAQVPNPAVPPSTPPVTPAASASTPTPAASSPPGTKSPKAKASAKHKLTPKRKASKNISSAETAQDTGTGSKRSRDAEPQPSQDIGGDSPPKRTKTEWEGPPNEALTKKAEEIQNIQSEEDAAAYLERMTERFREVEGQGLVSSEAVFTILKGCGFVPDVAESAPATLRGLQAGSQREPSPPLFSEFFDFSSFGTLDDDDRESTKAPTPDLLSSTSTNPSPESGSEAEPPGQLSGEGPKTDVMEASDPLQLGVWKEIDGGESAYYQQPDWRWDGPMPTLEEPWAIFTS